MNPNNAETETALSSQETENGTRLLPDEQPVDPCQRSYDQQDRTYDNMEVVLDEMVFSKEETKALGIETGDIVCFETRTRITRRDTSRAVFSMIN